MNNREKIIRAIEKAKKQSEENAQDVIIVPFKEADMIISLLKEQEPKTIPGFPTMEGVVIGNCPRCDRFLVGKENDPVWFCKYCGQAVEWK